MIDVDNITAKISVEHFKQGTFNPVGPYLKCESSLVLQQVLTRKKNETTPFSLEVIPEDRTDPVYRFKIEYDTDTLVTDFKYFTVSCRGKSVDVLRRCANKLSGSNDKTTKMLYQLFSSAMDKKNGQKRKHNFKDHRKKIRKRVNDNLSVNINVCNSSKRSQPYSNGIVESRIFSCCPALNELSNETIGNEQVPEERDSFQTLYCPPDVNIHKYISIQTDSNLPVETASTDNVCNQVLVDPYEFDEFHFDNLHDWSLRDCDINLYTVSECDDIIGDITGLCEDITNKSRDSRSTLSNLSLQDLFSLEFPFIESENIPYNAKWKTNPNE